MKNEQKALFLALCLGFAIGLAAFYIIFFTPIGL
jgi:hypothetical protein